MLVTKITNFVSGVPNLGNSFGRLANSGGVLKSKWAGRKDRTDLAHAAGADRTLYFIRPEFCAGV
jgi:hypothetical protein